ncbi:YegP family protein [uncultured Formosa sp.]|uniref:YegP family protein n=1 Tax=uncultured Formosa sp. TaxID=255435 RepID=UPI002605E202|nr:YegP family protein [uncultured Formosa sp.]
MAKFEVYSDKSESYRFRLVAGNGQNILASQGYSSKANCLNGVESVKTNSQDDSKYERLKSTSGQDYFNIKATNGQVIGTSQMYASTSGMENGIASVKTNAPDAPIVEV